MKNSVCMQFAIIRESSDTLLQERLNEQLQRLKDRKPQVKFSESDPLCVYIEYVVEEQEAETPKEKADTHGLSFVCSQCPHFRPLLKDDGTPDKRCKFGDCEYAELGRTLKNMPACEELYKLVQEGGVKICFAD